jgi:hypothetical protein
VGSDREAEGLKRGSKREDYLSADIWKDRKEKDKEEEAKTRQPDTESASLLLSVKLKRGR